MWTSSVLIIIATLAGLLALWRDEFIGVERPLIKKNETEKEKNERLEKQLKQEKTKKLKLISSFFIFLTLLFTLYQIHLTNVASDRARLEKRQQHMIDSTRYANDSLKHIIERKQDEQAHQRIDSIRKVQIEAYKSQILAGKTVDSIKIKSADILNNLSSANSTINSSAATLNESFDLAKRSFNELANASQRQLFLLDDKINMRFSFGFWSTKSEQTVETYLATNNIELNYVDIDENFPFYNEIQEVLNNIELEISFYDAKSKLRMIDQNGKTGFDYIGTPAMMNLKNKEKIVFVPYRKPGGSNPNLLYYIVYPEGFFKMYYHTPSKSFFFSCDNLPLEITGRQDDYFSILDYDSTTVRIELKTPEVRDNPNCFFNLNSSYINFQINFSNKKSTQYYSFIKPHNFYGNDLWPEYLIDVVRFHK